MADERLDYAVLISLLMREEAEVMASALRAEGIDAFLGNLHQASWNWGYVIAFGMVQAFSSDLYRVPFVIGPEVYVTASLVVCAAALASAWAIRGRINRLDMVEVLKTRE